MPEQTGGNAGTIVRGKLDAAQGRLAVTHPASPRISSLELA